MKRPTHKLPLAAPLAALLGACSSADAPREVLRAVEVPPTPRGNVVEDYHGTAVPDPYRWLEDVDAPETAAWVEAQSQVTERFLGAIDSRPALRARLAALWDHERYEPPERAGDWWIYRKNDGLQNQAVVYRTTSLDAPGEVLLDPNTLSADGTVAVGQVVPSEDGAHAVYAVSTAGSDWVEWRVVEIPTGALLPDRLRWSKFGTAAWTHDGKGFFYTRYPAPPEGEEHEAITLQPQLCYHRLRTEQTSDAVIYERPDEPRWGLHGRVTEDGRYLVIHVSQGTDRRNRLAYVDLQDPERAVVPLMMDFDAAYDWVGSIGSRFVIATDRGAVDDADGLAPNKRLIAVDLEAPAPEAWTQLVAEAPESLVDVRLVAGRFVMTYVQDAHHVLRVHALDGAPLGAIELPQLGAVSGMQGKASDPRAFFTFSSFTTPPAVYEMDFASGQLSVWRQPDLPFDPLPFVTELVFFQSEDGTRVPMFLVHRRSLALTGDHPTLLYGYGGFGIPMLPRFSVETAVWLESGGIYAQPALRGGSEYGVRWHEAGMLENKQNVFDDFLAAARYLLRNSYTRPDRLGILGRSNGGLLVGACLTQEPQLFGAAVPEVGVLDMLRYHRFTIGWAWVPEYGSSEDPEMFQVLHAYSPLHRIREGWVYPPTLIMTGDHDDRVLPGHSYKFAAALQHAQAGPAPILLRVETRAGHGAGTPTAKRIDAAADRLSFFDWALRAD